MQEVISRGLSVVGPDCDELLCTSYRRVRGSPRNQARGHGPRRTPLAGVYSRSSACTASQNVTIVNSTNAAASIAIVVGGPTPIVA